MIASAFARANSSPTIGINASLVKNLNVVSATGGESINTMRSTLPGLVSASPVATSPPME